MTVVWMRMWQWTNMCMRTNAQKETGYKAPNLTEG